MPTSRCGYEMARNPSPVFPPLTSACFLLIRTAVAATEPDELLLLQAADKSNDPVRPVCLAAAKFCPGLAADILDRVCPIEHSPDCAAGPVEVNPHCRLGKKGQKPLRQVSLTKLRDAENYGILGSRFPLDEGNRDPIQKIGTGRLYRIHFDHVRSAPGPRSARSVGRAHRVCPHWQPGTSPESTRAGRK